MPLYEYQCQQCQAIRDIRHGFDETTSEVCAHCGGPLVRLFRPAGIVFKGSGFYITDSRRGDESGDGAKSEAKSEAKSDAKPESSSPKTDAPAA